MSSRDPSGKENKLNYMDPGGKEVTGGRSNQERKPYYEMSRVPPYPTKMLKPNPHNSKCDYIWI